MIEFFVETLKQNSATCCLAFFLVLLLRILKSKENSKSSEVSKQPPGPKGYPVFGIFPKMVKKEAHLVFDGRLLKICCLQSRNVLCFKSFI